MKRALLVLLAACGGEGGEPIGGTIAVDVAGTITTPTVGATVARDAEIVVVLGTREIDCDTRIEDQLKRGVYVTFAIEPTELGPQNPFVSVIRVDPGGTHLNGGPGDVTLDGAADRITGSVTFATTDITDEGDIPISVTGTFDVRACF